jgi:hypothetical protein
MLTLNRDDLITLFLSGESVQEGSSRSGVIFTNILHAPFLYESIFCIFYLLTTQLGNFLAQEYGAKAARKMLVKLTTGQSSEVREVRRHVQPHLP